MADTSVAYIGARAWGLPGAEATLKLRSLRASGDLDRDLAFHFNREGHTGTTSGSSTRTSFSLYGGRLAPSQINRAAPFSDLNIGFRCAYDR